MKKLKKKFIQEVVDIGRNRLAFAFIAGISAVFGAVCSSILDDSTFRRTSESRLLAVEASTQDSRDQLAIINERLQLIDIKLVNLSDLIVYVRDRVDKL
jgi:hypothetical protein